MITSVVAGAVVGFVVFIVLLLAFSPFILSGSSAIEDERMELIGHLRVRLADSNERERLLGEELKKYAAMARSYDLSHDAEREWECAMMAAIGEDGVKSVSDAIAKLKDELKKYTEIAKGDCKACMVRRGIVSSERELEIEVER